MAIQEISDKTWKKWLEEEIELHKRVITNYLWEEGISLSGRNKFFRLYDHYISVKNIRDYLHIPVYIFVRAIIQDDLSKVKSYVQSRATKEEQARITEIAKAQQKAKRKAARAERRKQRKAEKNG